MNILLIAGGWSSEREISLAGAKAIEKALYSLKHNVTFFDLSKNFNNLYSEAKKHDFAFINLHGQPGEDGLPQAILERANCPYQGSGPAGSFLALNKAAAKQIFKNENIPTADWELLPAKPSCSWQPSIAYPLFVKSNTGGSSLHMGKANTREELDKHLSEIFSFGEAALLETAIEGKELTCGILDEQALPPVLIEPAAGTFFNFNSKYQPKGAREICPAPIDEKITKKIMEYALKAHQVLGLKNYSRSDFILSDNGNLALLEVNTLPGMTATSLVPQEAKAIGLDFPELLQRLIDLGLKTKRKSV